MRANLLLPPPRAGNDSPVSPERVEPHLLVRNIESARVDIGPIAWEELMIMQERIPSEPEADEKRRWIEDSLVWPEAPCFVPLGPDYLGETTQVAAFLANIVTRVVAVVDDVSLLALVDEQHRERLAGLEALLVGGEYVPMRGRQPVGNPDKMSILQGKGTGQVLVGSRRADWEELDELLLQLKEPGRHWSVPVPSEPPSDRQILSRLADAGCEEVRVSVRSFSHKVRGFLGESSGVEQVASMLRQCRRHGFKTAIALEVGFPDESSDVFLGGLRTLRGLAHLIDSVCDLRTFWTPDTGEFPHDWHDGAANNLSWRRKKGRELAAFLFGEGFSCPWFFARERGCAIESVRAIHKRLLASL